MSPNRRGSALLTVLWLSAALAAISLAVASNVRGEADKAATNTDDAKSYFVARGAIDRALLHMQWGENYYRYGQPSMDLSFPEAEVHVDIIPETAKIGLNGAPPEELIRLLLALGVTEDRANEITAAILDWRTPLPPSRTSPFDAFYLAQSPSFLPPHASFTENEELLLVRGITPDLYYGTSLDGSRAGLRDCVSAYTSDGALDINTARPETMIAAGISQADAATIVESRAQHPILDFREFAAIQSSLGPAGQRLRLGGNTMYTLRATARLRTPDGKLSDMRRTVAALVKFFRPGNPQNKPAGIEVVRWYDRG
jgi:general secretion pathway protein K